MSVPAKSRPPIPSSSDESAVRERTGSAAPASAPQVSPAPIPRSTSALAARDRLEAKLAIGRALLASLPTTDDRTRLLHLAIVRRDEALLEGVLGTLGVRVGSMRPER